jgi:glycosyltransferase involved in cell wall biosynthesis
MDYLRGEDSGSLSIATQLTDSSGKDPEKHMNESFLISIVTPCLNSEKTIEKTIQSVLNQSYSNLEYIVVDGQSSDGTMRILNHYQERDSRLSVISEKDNSMTEALNRGFRKTSGDLVASINADDWYELNTLKKVAQTYKSSHFHCLMGNTRLVSELGQTIYTTQPWLAPYTFAWHLMGCLTPECSVFYSRECLEVIGLFNETLKYTQDLEYYLRILRKYRIKHENTILSNFLISETQYSTRLRDKMEDEVMSFIGNKFIRRWCGGSGITTPLRLITGSRRYTYSQFTSYLSSLIKTHLKS